MRKTLLLLLLITAAVLAESNNQNKTLILKKTTGEIKIDGVIDPAWSAADSATNFFQLQQYYGQKPTWRTVAKVLTTDDAIYCLIKCYEDEKFIQRNTGMLDDRGGDIVSFMIDTFDDQKTAYKFAVSASGVKNDCRLLDDARNRDYSWDGIWFSAAKIYKWGYVVEMKIPYKSIQYDKSLNYWGIDFDRWVPYENEDLYWCRYEQNEGQRISKFGKLVFEDFHPSVTGLNLEIYPVGIVKAKYLGDNKYDINPSAGLDILYNPSPKLKFQLTANPDFAQIEADPFEFNISRYETYYNERRPFFTEGNEVFMAAGKQQNTGFYRPLELFYSRRIGKKLPDGGEVPLLLGTKAFGRLGDWEYGGFVAATSAKDYIEDNTKYTEPRAVFGAARIKKQVFGNSTLGALFVGKKTKDSTYGVLDIDGALRQSDWQLAYQFARSIKNSQGDYAASAGFTQFGEKWNTFVRGKYIGKNFDIDQVGYVPWIGTAELTGITGPIWYFDKGYIKQILAFAGFSVNHKDVENYTDHALVLVYNMQFRDNWGFEFDYSLGKSKDSDIKYGSYELDFSSWYNISPKWNANLNGGFARTYNFSRDYLAFYTWWNVYLDWKATDVVDLGTSYNMWVEGDPQGNIADITYDARPYISVTPINDLNFRIYVDNLFVKSSDRLEHILGGLLFSYNFSPKSWIYFAYNELRDRSDQYDPAGNLLPNKMHVAARAGVLKVKYLYYF